MQNFDEIVSIVKHRFKNQTSIPLHEPCFIGNEKKYLNSCIDSSYVSSVGEFVSSLEKEISSRSSGPKEKISAQKVAQRPYSLPFQGYRCACVLILLASADAK